MTGKEISRTLFSMAKGNYIMQLYWKYEPPMFAFYKPNGTHLEWYTEGRFVDFNANEVRFIRVGTRVADLIKYIARHNLEDCLVISNSHSFRTIITSDLSVNFDERKVVFQ